MGATYEGITVNVIVLLCYNATANNTTVLQLLCTRGFFNYFFYVFCSHSNFHDML